MTTEIERALRDVLADVERTAPDPAGLADRLVARAVEQRPARAPRTWLAPLVAAAIVATIVAATLYLTGRNRADDPVRPIETPSSTPDRTPAPAPRRLAQVFDVGDALIAREPRGQVWFRDAGGWQRRGRVQDFGLAFASNGVDGYGNEFATHDGGRTWTRYAEVPTCGPVGLAITDRTVYLPAFDDCASGARGQARVLDLDGTGSRTATVPPYVEPGRPPGLLAGAGAAIIVQAGTPGESTLSHILRSRDGARTWEELPQPCPATVPSGDAWLAVDVDRQHLVAACPYGPAGTTFFRLTDQGPWQSSGRTSIRIAEGDNWGVPVPGGWLVGTLDRSEVVSSTTTPARFPPGLRPLGGIATIGDAMYVIGTTPGVDNGVLLVSTDGGVTWKQEGQS